MLFKYIRSNINVIDEEFDLIYPDRIKAAADVHFTPVKVAKVAARYLANKSGARILDIGAGVGKFCMVGSACTEGYFVGVEQRRTLCLTAELIAKHYHLTNVEFINANITNISFKAFDAFYFYNSFYENVSMLEKIDDEIDLRRELYEHYSFYVKEQLEEMAIGTKLVTYYSFLKEVPNSYEIKHSAFGEKLKMWEKIR
jgi:Protein-L-isoaspartate(D-aspartate) O-methyltransferase (PCMT)